MVSPQSGGAALARLQAGKFRVVSYDELRRKATGLAEQILRRHGDRPGSLVMVPILMGGGLPAKLVIDTLKPYGVIRETVPCRLRRYSGVGEAGEVEFTLPLTADQVKGHIVIGVDDLVDGGQTLEAFLAHAKDLGAAQVEGAVIYAKPHSICRPDYLAEDGVTGWLILPGEEHEIMADILTNDLLVRALPRPERLAYFCALGLDAAIVEEWMALAERLPPVGNIGGVQ